MSRFLRVDRDALGQPTIDSIKDLLSGIHSSGRPPFAGYEPDLGPIREAAESLVGVDDLVVIGHGGSVTTFKGLSGSLGPYGRDDIRVHIVDTVDPAYLRKVRGAVADEGSHVLAVSRSGETLTVLEALSAFKGIPTTVVTVPGDNTLRALAEKRGWNAVDVPGEIGGRFSGRTASALLPSAALGLDIGKISEGIGSAYAEAESDRYLLDLAGALYLKERIRYRNMFIPVYSKGLSRFNDLVTQLLHETLGKNRKGPTVLCFEGPECQHHTNQRILDGAEDVVSLFVTVERGSDPTVAWEGEEARIPFRNGRLGDIVDLAGSMEAEAAGVMESMTELGMPWARMHLKGEGEEEIGFYIGMWHYMAYWFALLRRVEPFDQPAVERAKEIALKYRLKVEMG